MVRNDLMRFHVANGIKGGAGNIVRMQADAVQLSDAPFANRNKVRAYQYSFRVSRVQSRGDDEVFFHFS